MPLSLCVKCFFYSLISDQSLAKQQLQHSSQHTVLSNICCIIQQAYPSVNLECLFNRERGRRWVGSDGQVMVIVSLPPPVSDGTWSLWVLDDALRFGFGVRRLPSSCPETFLSFPLATQRLCQNVRPTVPGASVKTNHTGGRSC